MEKDKLITKSYNGSVTVIDKMGRKHVIFIYGELETKFETVYKGVVNVNYNYGEYKIVLDNSGKCAKKTQRRVRLFNMGYAICQEPDNFELKKGIEIAKSRFRAPLVSTNGRFLNEDMIYAIIHNELDYIVRNIDKYSNKQLSFEDIRVLRDNDEGTEIVKIPIPKFKEGDYVKVNDVEQHTVAFGVVKSCTDECLTFDQYWEFFQNENCKRIFYKNTHFVREYDKFELIEKEEFERLRNFN